MSGHYLPLLTNTTLTALTLRLIDDCSKFKNTADCQDFSYYALNHFAGTAEDSVEFDDDMVPQQDDRLQFGSGEGDVTVARRTTTTTSVMTDKEVQEVAEHAATTTTSVGDKEVQGVAGHMYYREYVVSQQRNGVCAFDPKYQVWVKTNCHGKSLCSLTS